MPLERAGMTAGARGGSLYAVRSAPSVRYKTLQLATLLTLVLLLPVPCAAESPSELEHHLSEEFRTAHFTVTSRVADLPAPIRAGLSIQQEPMADAGEDWNSSCIAIDDDRPRRRLIVGAVSPRLVAVLNENGGYPVIVVLSLFKVAHGGRVLGSCWYHAIGSGGSDLDSLRAAFPARFQWGGCETPTPAAAPSKPSTELEKRGSTPSPAASP